MPLWGHNCFRAFSIIVAFHPEQDLMSAFMGKGKSALPAQSMNLSMLNKAQIQKNLICFQLDCPLNAVFHYGVLCIGISVSPHRLPSEDRSANETLKPNNPWQTGQSVLPEQLTSHCQHLYPKRTH
jgi:hypothetical protein